VVAVQSQIDSVQRQMDEMVEEQKRRVEETRERLSGKVDPRLNSYKSDIARLQGEVKRQQTLLDQVEGQIAAVGGNINNVPGAEVELEAINREYQTEKGVYDQLVEAQKNAETRGQVAARAQGESITVIDPASPPQQPVAPKRPVLMLLGLVVGLAVGALLAALFEVPRLLTIQTSEDAAHYTGLPVLITLPNMLTAREQRSLRLRRAALGVAGLAVAVLSVPALIILLRLTHIMEVFASRG
jgi:hypothetical protein